MTPPIAKTLKLVIFQRPDGNPETIDAGESIALVGSEGGHVPPEKVAQTLAALGIRKIPVGTKIRALDEYVEQIQRAFRQNSDGTLFSASLNIAQKKAEAAGIQVDPKELPIVRKNFAEFSQATLKKGLKDLEAGHWLDANNVIQLAAHYAQKGKYSFKELDLALSCMQHLLSADAANRKGLAQERNRHLDQARVIAKELSISIEKSEQDILLRPPSSFLMHLQQNPSPTPAPAIKRPLIDLTWKWVW
ncbi:MAG TPA: hypothetical protein VJP40_08310 [bacterium]|nr:hypothetical protein [bacterium]